MNNFNIENIRFMCINRRTTSIRLSSCYSLGYFKKHVDESTILRLNDDSQMKDIYKLELIGNTPYNLQIYNKTQIIDVICYSYHQILVDTLYCINWATSNVNDSKGMEVKLPDFVKSTTANQFANRKFVELLRAYHL